MYAHQVCPVIVIIIIKRC